MPHFVCHQDVRYLENILKVVLAARGTGLYCDNGIPRCGRFLSLQEGQWLNQIKFYILLLVPMPNWFRVWTTTYLLHCQNSVILEIIHCCL